MHLFSNKRETSRQWKDTAGVNKRRNIGNYLMDQRNNSNLYAWDKLQNENIANNKTRLNQSSGRAQSLK